jgi:hypothetical protein
LMMDSNGENRRNKHEENDLGGDTNTLLIST